MQRGLDLYEQIAVKIGGQKAGMYLEEIGKTDLCQMTEKEWLQFLERFLLGYSESMRDQIDMHDDIPF